MGSGTAPQAARDARDRALGGGHRGLRERRSPARPRRARAPPEGRRRAPRRDRARRLRDGRLPRRPHLDPRGGGLGSRRPRVRPAACTCCSAAATSDPRLRLERRARQPRGARAPLRRAARRGCPGLQDPLPSHRLAPRRRRRRGGARCGRPRLPADGRREPGLAHAGRPPAALGRRDRRAVRAGPRAARRVLARGAAATTDLDGYRGAAHAHRPAHRGGRDGAHGLRGPRPRARGVDVVQPDIVLAGGFGGCRRIAAHAELHGRAWSPHTWSNGYGFLVNLHGALGLSSVPVRRGAVRPADLVDRPPRLPPARADRDGAPTARSRRPTARASASSRTSTRSRHTVSAERSPCARRCCASRAARSRSRRSALDPPRAGEVQVRVAAAGVCHSDVHLADGVLGEGRWPMVLGPRGRGRRRGGRAGREARATRRSRRLLLRAVVRALRAMPRRTHHPVRRRRREHGARHADGRHIAPARRATARRCSTG